VLASSPAEKIENFIKLRITASFLIDPETGSSVFD
jgi:hypothetical protein